MNPMPLVDASEQFASYHFVTVPTGCGWDLYRIWSTELDWLLLPAHVPVLVVDRWDEICDLVADTNLHQKMVQRYKNWIAKSYKWLRPGLWIPRDQARMDTLCQELPGCVKAHQMMHRMTLTPPGQKQPTNVDNNTAHEARSNTKMLWKLTSNMVAPIRKNQTTAFFNVQHRHFWKMK
jgi:hypothetical protein